MTTTDSPTSTAILGPTDSHQELLWPKPSRVLYAFNMDTYSDRNRHTIYESAAPEEPFTTHVFVAGAPVSPERTRTCGQCQYDGPMQVRHTYPLILRWPVIATGFALGIVPGLFLLGWRRGSPSTIAMTCPMCQFLRLERVPATKASSGYES